MGKTCPPKAGSRVDSAHRFYLIPRCCGSGAVAGYRCFMPRCPPRQPRHVENQHRGVSDPPVPSLPFPLLAAPLQGLSCQFIGVASLKLLLTKMHLRLFFNYHCPEVPTRPDCK